MTTRVLVTGCSSGLGRRCAGDLAGRGLTVFAGMRDVRRADGLGGPRPGGGVVHVLPLDVCDDASVDGALARAQQLAGGVDAVVCNAGVEVRGPLEHTDPDDLRWVLETNVVGAHRVVRAVLPAMRAAGAGRVVFISSVVGLAARPLLGAYSASKFAVEGLAEALALETGPFGIQVCLVEPGRFPSRLGDNARIAGDAHRDSTGYARIHAAAAQASARLEPAGYRPDPDAVAEAVHDAVTRPDPPLRIPVGVDATSTADLVGGRRIDAYARLFHPVTPPGDGAPPAEVPGPVTGDLRALASAANLALLTTLAPGGQPRTHVVWIDLDGPTLLVNTEVHRAKFRDMSADPRVTVALVDRADPHRYAEIRGHVVEFVHGEPARRHIDALSRKYRGHDYDPAIIRSARVIARIEPRRIVRIDGRHVRTVHPEP
jgi:PPOX class probable F420-dependent enzyme